MIKELNFRFNELTINPKAMETTLGFENGAPEPFDDYIQQAWKFSESLTDIRVAFTILNQVTIEEESATLITDKAEFNIGKIIRREIRNSARIAFFVCTAGKTLSDKSKKLMQGEDLSLGYVYDVMGTFIAEAAGDKMQEILAKEVSEYGEKISNRYSPGYCQWSVADQHKLFSHFPENICGVSLTPSGLMHPVKSISGIIGIGKDVKFRDYTCGLCSDKNCIYRSKNK